MCGRYYVDDETAREIEKLVRQVDSTINTKSSIGDIYPSSKANVLYRDNNYTELACMNWGFPNFNQKGVIFNARCESVKDKKMFSESIRHRRCIIPAKGFYEWDKMKNKVTFERMDGHVMYMAGAWNEYQDENYFVILTTKANSSMEKVHDRMPLVLEKKEFDPWLYDEKCIDYILNKIPSELKITSGYVQQTFDFL